MSRIDELKAKRRMILQKRKEYQDVHKVMNDDQFQTYQSICDDLEAVEAELTGLKPSFVLRWKGDDTVAREETDFPGIEQAVARAEALLLDGVSWVEVKRV